MPACDYFVADFFVRHPLVVLTVPLQIELFMRFIAEDLAGTEVM
jgi:hypothetical protein